jgi:hypothetical protein
MHRQVALHAVVKCCTLLSSTRCVLSAALQSVWLLFALLLRLSLLTTPQHYDCCCCMHVCTYCADVFDGEWLDDKAHGWGMKSFANGDRHEGKLHLGAISLLALFDEAVTAAIV